MGGGQRTSKMYSWWLYYLYQLLTILSCSGALVYLLDLFCNSSNPTVRAKAAELFNKMMADKLVGPKVKITLSKFLPTIFMDAMRENPEISVHMFEGKNRLTVENH